MPPLPLLWPPPHPRALAGASTHGYAKSPPAKNFELVSFANSNSKIFLTLPDFLLTAWHLLLHIGKGDYPNYKLGILAKLIIFQKFLFNTIF